MNTNGVPIIQPRIGQSRTGEELPWVFVQTKHPTLTGLDRISTNPRRKSLRTATYGQHRAERFNPLGIVRDKIRLQLQVLREAKLLFHVGSGLWRLP